MKAVVTTGAVAAIALSTIAAGTAQAYSNGPDSAPPITVGVTYTGNSGYDPATELGGNMWRLPGPLYIGSQVTVASRGLDAEYGDNIGIAGDVDSWDYIDRWMELTDDGYFNSNSPSVDVLGVGAACSVCYLEFGDEPDDYSRYGWEYPYQFVVQSIKHRASLSILSASRRGKKISVNGRALMADAATPVPAGTVVTLTLWRKGYKVNLTASAGADGSVAYRGRLPWKKRIKMKLRLAGSSYVSSASAKVVR